MKILCLEGTEELVGATVVAERAGEVLNELTLAIQHGVKLSQLARTVHPYPTLGEAVQQCALTFNRSRWAKMATWQGGRSHLGCLKRADLRLSEAAAGDGRAQEVSLA